MTTDEKLWNLTYERDLNQVHLAPHNDLIGHEKRDCSCGPQVNSEWRGLVFGVEAQGLVTHHALDGREHEEVRHVTP